MGTWPDGDGIVELPSGRRVRGRGLRRTPTPGITADFGVYLLARAPGGVSWDHTWVRCRDFRSPSDLQHTVEALRTALERAATERVEVGCGGGRGRTGIALAVLAVLDGVEPDSAVAWVRSHYHRRAAETPWQRRWIARVGAEISSSD